MVRSLVEQYRPWELTNLGAGMSQNTHLTKDVTFSFLSYNVLSQQLLDEHFHLYQRNDPRALGWEHRSQVLLKELANINADVSRDIMGKGTYLVRKHRPLPSNLQVSL